MNRKCFSTVFREQLARLAAFTGGAQADFVEHAAEVNEAFDLVIRAAEPRNDGWIELCHGRK